LWRGGAWKPGRRKGKIKEAKVGRISTHKEEKIDRGKQGRTQLSRRGTLELRLIKAFRKKNERKRKKA